MASLRSDIRRMLADAKADLQRDGDLVPRLLVRGEVSSARGFIQFAATSDERRQQLFAVGLQLAGLEPQYIVLVSDTYMKVANNAPLELALERSLADDPAAGEALVAISLDRRGRSRALVVPYERHPRLEGLEIEFRPRTRLPHGRPDAYILEGFFEGVKTAEQTGYSVREGATDFRPRDGEREE